MAKRGDSANYALEISDVKAVMLACETQRDRVIVGGPMFLSFRVSELAHMNASWLTVDGNIKIPPYQQCDCLECQKERGGEWKPKSKAGARTLPISRPIKADLLNFLRANPKGLRMTRQAIWQRTKYLLKKAKVKIKGLAEDTAYPHALRATCASMLAAGGMDAAALTYFMGWSSIKMGDHYIKLSTAKGSAAHKAKEIFGG